MCGPTKLPVLLYTRVNSLGILKHLVDFLGLEAPEPYISLICTLFLVCHIACLILKSTRQHNEKATC